MKRAPLTHLAALAAAAVLLLGRTQIAQAVSDVEQGLLAMYFTADELRVVSATRSLQSIARIAENIEVVTADDIELMNAHTLADVLETVSGTLVWPNRQFGVRAAADIQGAGSNRVSVFLNGVPLNYASENISEVGFIPVEDIERVEVVKGPASSAWGSALGGVVNVITKGPGSRPFQGKASLDYGSKSTADYRAAISGRSGGFGYYLSGTGLRTDGFTDGFDLKAGHLGTRLEYALGGRATASFNLFYGDASRGEGQSVPDDWFFETRSKRLVSNLSLDAAVGKEGRLNLALWTTRYDDHFKVGRLSDGSELSSASSKVNQSGTDLSYAWDHDGQAVVVGGTWSTARLIYPAQPDIAPSATQWALYANDTISLGPWAIIPGLRYDKTLNGADFWSPSLGTTYAFSRSALARAIVARGFTSPSLADTSVTDAGALHQANPNLVPETVWSYQLGLEFNVADLCWLKLSGFRHDVEDAIEMVWLSPDWWTNQNVGRQRRQGVQAEFKTVPFHNLALAGSAFFMKTTNLETGAKVIDVPEEIYDLSLTFNDGRGLRGLLRGRYIRQEAPPDFNADLGGFVFDLNLMRKFAVGASTSLEAFATVHNLFNGAQYRDSGLQNPGRWVEGGLRVTF
jgi:vitamin B12 transporter